MSRCSRKVASSEARNITKDDVVDADAIRERCRAFGILGLMAHSHADIGIVTDGDHNATFIVANGTPCRNGTIRSVRAPSPDIPRPRNLNAVVQVVNDMEDFVLVLYIYTYEGYEGSGLDGPANRKLEAAREQRKNRGQRVA